MTLTVQVPLLGDARCPDCGRPVYRAWDAGQEVVVLELDGAGDIAAAADPNHIPWCRPAAGAQLSFDDQFYRLHQPACDPHQPARDPRVVDIRSARSALARSRPVPSPLRRASGR
jgi:hypothetical protein